MISRHITRKVKNDDYHRLARYIQAADHGDEKALMPFTLPEVQTYLQGITIGGHKETDECKLKRQAEAWKYLIYLVENEKFKMTKGIAWSLWERA